MVCPSRASYEHRLGNVEESIAMVRYGLDGQGVV